MTGTLDTVVELQHTLDELKLAQERIEGIPDWMQELHAEHSAKKEEIDALAQEEETATLEHRTAQAGVQDHQEKLQTYQTQIGQVRNQREYGALLHEIDATKEAVRQFEEQSLAALDRQESARKAKEELAEAFEELDQKYQAELEKWEAEKPSVAQQIEDLKAKVETLREALPRRTLVIFERIFDRYDGHALSEVFKVERLGKKPQIYHCATCNYRVRPQAVVEITNQGKIVTCDSCKKILYLSDQG